MTLMQPFADLTDAPMNGRAQAVSRLVMGLWGMGIAGGLSAIIVAAYRADWLAAASALGLFVGVLLLSAGGLWVWGRRRAGSVAALWARSLGTDPAMTVVTGTDGRVIRALSPSGGQTLVQLFEPLTVAPEQVIHSMIETALVQGHARQSLGPAQKAVDVQVHCADLQGPVLIWRVQATASGTPRAAMPPGLPIVQRRGDQVSMNAAAHDEVSRSPGLLTALSTLDDVFGMQPLLRSVLLPDGHHRMVMICRGAAEEQLMVLLPALESPINAGTATDGLDRVPVALLSIDRAGRVVSANAMARKLLDLAVESDPFLWDLVDELGRPISAWLEDAWNGRSLAKPEVVRARNDDGFIQIVLQRGMVEDHLIAVLTDATEHKSLEAKFVQSQKMQAIGQLAGGVAHDFNNLLTAISGHCDLLLLNRDRHDPDYEDLLQIYQNTNRAAALVRQLLAYSRKQKLQTEIVDLETLLEDVVHLLARLVGEKIDLSMRHDPQLGQINADPRQLEQVLMNLVVNARDAMPMGGTIQILTRHVDLGVARPMGRVSLPPGPYAQIDVIDSGIGMSPEICEKIFEPFFTTKRMGEGTGLGLSTVYGIVKQMGGYVFVRSVEGAGTTFSLYFASHRAGHAAGMDSAGPDNAGTDTAALVRETPRALTVSGDGASRTDPDPAAPLPTRSGRNHDLDGNTPPQRDASPPPRPVAREGAVPRSRPGIARASARPAAPRPEKEPGLSEFDAGATPAHRPSSADGRPAAPPEKRTILLVEDETPVRNFASRALKLQGYSVIEANDGEAALEALRDPTLKVDLFLTDVIMPAVDGPAWVARAFESGRKAPVIFMSGYAESTLNEALNRIERSSFLAKPFSLSALVEAVDAHLAASSASAPAAPRPGALPAGTVADTERSVAAGS